MTLIYYESVSCPLILSIIYWSLYSWNTPISDQWRNPLIVITGTPTIFFLQYDLILKIVFQRQILDSTSGKWLIISVIMGLSALIFIIIKKNYQGRNQWRLSLTFVLSAVVILSGFLISVTIVQNIKIAFLTITIIGISFILIGLYEFLCKSQIKWLLIVSLCVGVITIVSGIIGIMLC